MSMGYRRNQETHDPFWVLLGAFFVVALFLVALPSIIVGFFAQRYLAKYLHWRWSFAIWFILVFPAAFLFWSRQDLQSAMVHTVLDYIQAAKLYQLDLTHWPLGQLWAETWPLWIQTLLIGIPVSGFWFEIITNMRTDTAAHLLRSEQSRQRRIRRTGEKARKRARQPAPDTKGSAMVIGVPIKDEEQE